MRSLTFWVQPAMRKRREPRLFGPRSRSFTGARRTHARGNRQGLPRPRGRAFTRITRRNTAAATPMTVARTMHAHRMPRALSCVRDVTCHPLAVNHEPLGGILCCAFRSSPLACGSQR
jgi:hypothetical protein